VHGPPGPKRGDWVAVTDRGERIGVALTTRPGVRPVYVSVGNGLGLLPSARIVLATSLPKQRLPEPIRQADRLSRRLARAATTT
jgi:deoxyribonuclease V